MVDNSIEFCSNYKNFELHSQFFKKLLAPCSALLDVLFLQLLWALPSELESTGQNQFIV